jgi:L-threonylcarbamoyladenylate synthase
MAMEIVRGDEAGLARAALIVRGGGLVVYPTETLYGLGAAALDDAAVERLLEVKGRGTDQPVPVLVADRTMLLRLVQELSSLAEALIARHWPGPLTLVLPARPNLPRALVNARGGVGVRISADPVAAALVREVGGPLTATSANRKGETPPSFADQVSLDGVGLALDAGERSQLASTVVELLPGREPRILRQGAIAPQLPDTGE